MLNVCAKYVSEIEFASLESRDLGMNPAAGQLNDHHRYVSQRTVLDRAKTDAVQSRPFESRFSESMTLERTEIVIDRETDSKMRLELDNLGSRMISLA